jgi:DUF2934 family protein
MEERAMKLRTRPKKFRAASSGHNGVAARVATSGPSETSSSDGVHTRIAALAYQLYEQRGREDGHDVEDWIQAEQRIHAINPAGVMDYQS